MPLARCRWALGPLALRQPRLKTGSDRCDGGLETREKSDRPQAQDAAAIRASKSAQQQSLAKTIEEGRKKTMPPQTLRLAVRAAIGLGPIKIAPQTKNLVEFYVHGKYHLINLLRGQKPPVSWVRRSANRRTLFLK